jgi:hypothetical protein
MDTAMRFMRRSCSLAAVAAAIACCSGDQKPTKESGTSDKYVRPTDEEYNQLPTDEEGENDTVHIPRRNRTYASAETVGRMRAAITFLSDGSARGCKIYEVFFSSKSYPTFQSFCR